MNLTDKDQLLEFPAMVARICKEAALIIVIGLNLFLLLALLGYDGRDPGWSHLGYQPETRNFTGVVGAWLADLAFSAVGVCAYLLPALIVLPSVRFLLRKQVGMMDAVPFFILRTCGALVTVASLAALAATHFDNQSLQLPFSAGGLLGEALSDQAVGLFSILGSSVLLFTLCLFGLTLFLETSWSAMLEKVGTGVVGKFEQLQERLERNRGDDHEYEEYDEYEQEDEDNGRQQALDAVSRIPMGSPRRAPETPERVEPLFAGDLVPQDATDTDKEEGQPSLPFNDKSAATPIEPEVEYAEVSDVDVAPLRPEPEQQTPDDLPWDMDVQSAADVQAAATQAVAEPEPQVVAPVEENRKNVRIVPLSETHKPMQDKDLGLDGAQGSTPSSKQKMRIPSLDKLDPPELNQSAGYSPDQLESMSRLLEAKLKDFNVIAEVVEVNPGPVITRFEIQPAPGVKASKVSNLAKDLARSMAVSSVRVVEVIAGKSVIGVEIPNEERQTVHLSEVLNSKPYLEAPSKLTLGLGNDIAGNPVVANLAKMPHLLVAGTTGSGKSVGVNAMLLSLLFKATPDEVRLMLVDPKMLELSIYDGIPHLLTPVITDMKDAAAGLRWCVGEMEERYRLMAKMGVRNIAGFNEKLEKARKAGEPIKDPLWNPEEYGMPADSPAPELKPLPYIVVVIDEFADMMMIVGKKVEELIARIAQKARAAGIHLILATQRPSVDVITGLIKANIPTRIAFQVSSKIDSRTILDQSGAEHLLGWGDMLYLPAGTSLPNRVHGAFVSDDEVHRVVEAWKKIGSPVFVEEILNAEGGDSVITGSGGLFDDEQDPLYDEAVAFVTETRKASISSVQRRLKIGYNRSARMIEAMEAAGVVSPAGSNGQREVLAPPPVKD